MHGAAALIRARSPRRRFEAVEIAAAKRFFPRPALRSRWISTPACGARQLIRTQPVKMARWRHT